MSKRLGIQYRNTKDQEITGPGRAAGFGPFTIGVTDTVPLELANAYATVAAEEWFRQGRRASLLQLLFVFPLSVVRDLFLKGGILEGKTGIVLATLGAFYSFSKHARLWELERETVARRKLDE